jgi:AraC family transcriptional regulator of adaptative response / DNA-3-methyladenine glycosylase II
MELDLKICSRARLARDPRFDGKFFIGVRTSGVYCRPICPARTANERNVRYFPTAAAAAEAGFRPCLRCRPECSPGTPAWLGTPSTVLRALRLIDENMLDEGGIETLAERLGVGSRHLRRLFLQYLGASPMAVLQTRRLQFAKKLIDDTTLPMNQIAIAAGFGCVRRFNAAIRKVYDRTPSHIRALSREKRQQPQHHYEFRLRYRPPYDWERMLKFLVARATPENEALLARVQFEDPRSLFVIVERIRAMFDLNGDWSEIARTLKRDALLKERMQAAPGLRVPGCWDGFELTIRAILGQQVTVAGATTLAGRLAKKFGRPFAAGSLTHLFPTAEILGAADLGEIGLTKSRAETIRAVARAASKGEIDFGASVDARTFVEQLCTVPGIGQWTAQYVAMRALREPDAYPTGDLGLLRALDLTNARELDARAEAWKPWRAYAAMYLWCVNGNGNRQRSKRAAS